MNRKQAQSALKGLTRVARKMAEEADRCQLAADLSVVRGSQHAKNAATWRGYERACWKAINLLADRDR